MLEGEPPHSGKQRHPPGVHGREQWASPSETRSGGQTCRALADTQDGHRNDRGERNGGSRVSVAVLEAWLGKEICDRGE